MVSFCITAPLEEDVGKGSGEVTWLLIMAVSEDCLIVTATRNDWKGYLDVMS
jgi:hypothetical protein